MIRAAWETPTNEGTKTWEIGQQMRHLPDSYKDGSYDFEWTVCRIIVQDDKLLGPRLIVYDTEGKRRISMPVSACGWEWFRNEEKGG